MKRDLVVACSLSLLLCIFVNAYSTGDIEESTKISYSVAVNDSSNGKSGGPRTVGTYSYFGVPLYDALQGTGNRLPYQASWAQSPEWPLRFLVSKQQFVLIRMFFSSLLLHLAAFRLLRSWTSNLSLARQVLFGLLLQTLAGLYVRQLEWSDTYSQSVGILGITFVLLHRSNFVPRQLTDRGILRSASDVLIVFGCVALVVTGHPGVFPIAAFVLIPVLLTCLWVSPVFRWRLAQTVRNSPLELALIFHQRCFSSV
jgi:hypothetical protein